MDHPTTRQVRDNRGRTHCIFFFFVLFTTLKQRKSCMTMVFFFSKIFIDKLFNSSKWTICHYVMKKDVHKHLERFLKNLQPHRDSHFWDSCRAIMNRQTLVIKTHFIIIRLVNKVITFFHMWIWSAEIETKNSYSSRIFIIQIYTIETPNTQHNIHWNCPSLIMLNAYFSLQQCFIV